MGGLHQQLKTTTAAVTSEVATVKLRYKEPDEDISQLLVNQVEHKVVPSSEVSDNTRFASAVAGFGMLLRNS